VIEVRVTLPTHLRTLARIGGELRVEVADPPSISSVLDVVESRYPVLRGTIRDHATRERRAYLRFFACGHDLSHESPDEPLPAPVRAGEEPLQVIGAIAGG
jgi:molybdopterin synthase sulfur carrier subunit